LYKTNLCDTFEEFGECKYGDKCQYAHGKHELRAKPVVVLPTSYKTVRCKKYWGKDSICPYGTNCKFAHDNVDRTRLKSKQYHAKYKTERCKTYVKLKTCPYGDQCGFICGDELQRMLDDETRRENEHPETSRLFKWTSGSEDDM
jgi:butyrate response factor 1